MEHITSRSALPESDDEISKSPWFNMWKVRLQAYKTLTVGDILYWYDTRRGALVWKTRVEDVDRFEYQNKTAAGDRMERRFGSFDRSERYFKEKPSRGYCLAYKVSPIQKLHVPKPERNVPFPRHGWLHGGPRIQYWLRGTRKGAKRVLEFGISARRRKASAKKKARRKSNRRPSDFEELKKSYQYVLGTKDRTVIPEHHNYQVRLKQYLESRGIRVELERDYVDISFAVDSDMFIGEIKVTKNLTLPQAFRAALGQLLDYSHAKFETIPRMIIFLDKMLDKRRRSLATELEIAVVVEQKRQFKLVNPEISERLRKVFK